MIKLEKETPLPMPTITPLSQAGMPMTRSSPEQKIRAALPVIRFLQTSIPLPIARWFLDKSLKAKRLGPETIRKHLTAAGVPCQWIIPQEAQKDQVLLYFHGGGFVFGLTPQHLEMAEYLAHQTDLRILMVDYRLAPEHPYPAALDDCAAAYHWLLNQDIPADEIAVAGDSAGGNLALTLMMRLHSGGFPLPAAAACLSPAADLTLKDQESDGFQDPLLPPKAVQRYKQAYAGNKDPHNPLISPVYGSFQGLPPLLVHVGEDEILRADAERITDLAQAANVEVRLKIYPGMWHVWQLFLSLPQAVQSLNEIAAFLKLHLSRETQPADSA